MIIMIRHRWGDKVVISPNKTERECLNRCGIVKVTRHEFWRGLDRIEGAGTPVCEPVGADA